jgi:hypothetical protein
MTLPYQWNPMPHVVDVTCPTCRARATFEFAEVVRIRRKADVEYFKNSPVFEYRFVEGDYVRPGNWHAAIYFHGLHRRSLPLLKDVPPGYDPEDWAHSKYWYRSHGGDFGTLVCRECRLKKKHQIAWPSDAYYQVRVRDEVLWAFNRDSLIALHECRCSRASRASRYAYQS